MVLRENKEKYVFNKKDIDKSMKTAFKQNDEKEFKDFIRELTKK